ncbi:MAG: GtrA family protein [Bryobacteraceae bacterium]
MTRATGKGVPREFISFMITGGIAALINIGARIVFNLFMRFEIAVVVAYLCGMTTAYVLARYFVFERSGRAMHDEYIRFTLVNLAAIAQVWIVSVGLADFGFQWLGFTWHSYTVAHVIGVAVPVFTSYIGHKRFSFARRVEKLH